ncbi:hypothetical protein ACOMHN_025406 [Nucella lapillus]
METKDREMMERLEAKDRGSNSLVWLPTLETATIPEMSVRSSDNQLENRIHDFCERRECHHQTARKMVAGALREEKTDAPKSCTERAGEEQTPHPENTADRETVRPENMTNTVTPYPDHMADTEIPRPEKRTDRMTCLENVTRKEGPYCSENVTKNETIHPEKIALKESIATSACPFIEDVAQDNNPLKIAFRRQDVNTPGEKLSEKEQTASELKAALKRGDIYVLGEKLSEKDETTSEVGKPWISPPLLRLEKVAKDWSIGYGPDTDKIKMATRPQERKLEEREKGHEKEELSSESTQKLIGMEGGSSLCLEKKLTMIENTQPSSSDFSVKQKKGEVLENQQEEANRSGRGSGLDNRLLEELDSLPPMLEHVKNQIKALASTLEADMAVTLLNDFMNCWKSVNAVISKAARSGSQHVSDQMKDSFIEFMDKLLANKMEHCLTNQRVDEKGVKEEKESLLEGESGRDQPRDQGNAIETVLALSQQNKLINTSLTRIYSCLQEHQPASLGGNPPCSKDLKSLLNSLNHSTRPEESAMWDILKEEDRSMGGLLDKTAEGRKENRGLSLKADLASLHHLSELPLDDDEMLRSPVENSFYFSTYDSSSFPHPDVSLLARGGIELRMFLSLIQKLVRQVGFDSKTFSLQTAEQKSMNSQVSPLDDLDDETENRKELDSLTDEQKGAEETKVGGEKDLQQEMGERQTEMVDDEKSPEKADIEEKEPTSSHSTEADLELREESELEELEIKEKSEDEESEKVQKEESTAIEPCLVTEAVEPTSEENAACNTQESDNADCDTLSSPATLKQKPFHAKLARKQQRNVKTEGRTKSAKMERQAQQQQIGNRRGEKNQGPTPKKKKRHQNIIEYEATKMSKNKTQTVRKADKKSLTPTKGMTRKTWISEQDRIDGGKKPQLPATTDPMIQSSRQCTSQYDLFHASRPPSVPGNGGKRRLLMEPDWLDVRGGKMKVRSAGDNPHGASQGSGGSTGSSAGGTSNAQGWGGARPKTNGTGGSGGGRGGGGGDREDDKPPARKVPDSLPFRVDVTRQKRSPQRDYKGHRKKQHGAASNEQLCHCLGQAGQGLAWLQQASGLGEVNRCLTLCLHDTQRVTSPTPDDLACCTCAILHSLLSHFSLSAHDHACPLCLQLFTIIHFHILDCQRGWGAGGEEEGERLMMMMEEEESAGRNVCRRMRQTRMFASSTVTVTKTWAKVRKYLSAALGPVLLLDVGLESEVATQIGCSGDYASESSSLESSPSGDDNLPSSGSLESGRKPPTKDGSTLLFETSAQRSTPAATKPVADSQASASDPSGGLAAVMPKVTAGSKLCRRPSHKVVPQKTIPEEPSSLHPSPHPSPTPPASPAQGSEQGAAAAAATSEVAGVTLPSVFPRQAENPEEGDYMMEIIRRFDEHVKVQQAMASRRINDDPYATQKTYGQGGTISMPDTRDRLIRGEQTLSVEMQPRGTPGIGEVVYGTCRQLRLVAQNWSHERDRCKASGICQYQHREEGVILDPFKKKLRILRTRYQKHHQWERLVHLGNGVTGKCHLCIDRTSNFQFCCKKVHILHYEDQEMDIWSKLDHPKVVRFYGAIRHGEKIYMFAEFIDGGSLAALIKEQMLVGRRLSHWTALNYFRQILKVITYLQTMGVLHEDIKADNLLLRDSTTEIVLADFGVAQQIPHDHTPPNRYPVGSPAHWCPEKAASEGHGFSSDLWASACVLIHMLSGSPPWINRFPDAAILNYIIWSKPPPLDDLPKDVKDTVRNLLSCCLVKDKAIRPTAEQILSHPAFKLLDQTSSLFSIAHQTTVGYVFNATPPSVNLQAAPQADQAAAPQADQAVAPQADQAAAPQADQAAAPQADQAAAPQADQAAAPQADQAAAPQADQAVEPQLTQGASGCQSLTATPPSSSELSPVTRESLYSPQTQMVRVVEMPRQSASRPGIAPSQRIGPQSLPGSLPTTNSKGSNQPPPDSRHGQQPPSQRKSDPGTSAPFSAQEAGSSNLGPQRKMGRVMQHFDMKTAGGEGSIMMLELPGHQRPELRAGLLLDKGLVAYDPRGENLQPVPWPELPSPVFSLTTTPPSTLPHLPSTRPPEPRLEGQTFFPTAPQPSLPEMGRSTLTVPAPVQPGVSEGSGDVAASALDQQEEDIEQAQLSSYGAGLGSTHLGIVPGSEPHPLPQELGPRVTPQGPDVQPPPLTRVDLSKSMGPPLRLYTVPHHKAEEPHTHCQGAERKVSDSERNTAESSAISTSAPLGLFTFSSDAQDAATLPGLQTNDQTWTTQRADNHGNILNQYPALPALSPEDFQLSANRCGTALLPTTALSIIPEGVEQESVSPSAQGDSSGGNSGEGTMWNFIQDQFSCQPADSGDQLMQSLRQQSVNRPRLELYDPCSLTTSQEAWREEVCRQPPVLLPRFELLQSSLSDSSTLRSCKIASSEEPSAVMMTASSEENTSSKETTFSKKTASSKETSTPSQQTSQVQGCGQNDEPDYTLPVSASLVEEKSGSTTSASSPAKKDPTGSPLTLGGGEEEHISSWDIFGEGPPINPFTEAYQYRRQQEKSLPPVTSASQQTLPRMSQPTRSLAKKQPNNLRLNMSKPVLSSTAHSGEADTTPQAWGSSAHPGDNTFLLHTGVSPMTASPVFTSTPPPSSTPWSSEGRSRSRNESGSSASTPKSSTFEQQELEYNTLQLHTSDLGDILLEESIITSGSESSSTQHLSLLYEPQGEDHPSYKEENEALSWLQEGIRNVHLGGNRLVFEDKEGRFLFGMRVLSNTKEWRELAMTFRGKVSNAGFRHFKLEKLDGTPVNCFEVVPYSSADTVIRVIALPDDHNELYTICWCVNHLMYV